MVLVTFCWRYCSSLPFPYISFNALPSLLRGINRVPPVRACVRERRLIVRSPSSQAATFCPRLIALEGIRRSPDRKGDLGVDLDRGRGAPRDKLPWSTDPDPPPHESIFIRNESSPTGPSGSRDAYRGWGCVFLSAGGVVDRGA